MVDTLRLVGSEDVGKDKGTVQLLIKKHDEVSDELLKFDENVRQLRLQVNFQLIFLRFCFPLYRIIFFYICSSHMFQAEALPPEAREHPDVLRRLDETAKRRAELKELARLRKQRLLDALSLYKLFSDADSIEAWIDEKVVLCRNCYSPSMHSLNSFTEILLFYFMACCIILG